MDNIQKIISEGIYFPSFIFFLLPTILKGERGEVREFGTDIAYTMYRLLLIPKLGKTDWRQYND
jgi:hypothetical protein